MVPNVDPQLFHLLLDQLPAEFANQEDRYGKTYSHYAAINNNLEIINPRHVFIKSSNGTSPYSYLSSINHLDRISNCLTNIQCSETLHDAALTGDLAQVYANIADNADINLVDAYGNTPLHFAAQGGYKEAVQMLLNAGADKNLKNISNETAADIARTDEIRDLINS